MTLRASALPHPVLGVIAGFALAGCGGGSSSDKPAIASAQISPVTESASALAAVDAAQAASAPASAASASPEAPAAKILSATGAADGTKASTAPAKATTSTTMTASTSTAATGSSATATKVATIGLLSTAATAAAVAGTVPPATATAGTTSATPKAVVATPLRYSPLWTLANTTTLKAGALTGMALLTNASTGIFNGPRVAKEDWTTLTARYKSDASVTQWVKTEQTRVDAWMAKNFERPDLIGGWVNYYLDAKTGLPLKWTPDDPEPANGTTDATRRFKAAWVAQGRTYNIAQMEAAARIYRTTGITKYADWAAKQLDFYAQQYAKWPVSTYEGRSTMFMQGLDEAVALFPLIDTARLLDGYAGATRAATWHNQFFAPMASNLKSTSAPKSNIQLWHASAIAAIAMRYHDAAFLDYAINDPAGVQANMTAGLTADNLWIEGSFSYNTYVIQCLSSLLTVAGVEGYADKFTAQADGALRMLLAPMEYRFDDGTLPNPGDSTSAQVVINNLAHWYLFRSMPTYWGVSVASSWRTWESLLDPPAPTKATTAPAIPTASTKNFDSLRWSVLRAGSWQAFVRYGGMLGNHWSDEAFNFELHQGQTAIAADPGTVTYGSPYHAGYFQRGPAANAPLVDGDNQTKWAPGTLTSFDALNNTVSAEQPLFQVDADVSRTFKLTSSGLVEQSVLKVPSGKTRRLGMAFSSSCDMAPGTGVTAATGQPALPAVTAFGYWTNTATYTTGTSWQLTLKCAGGKNYLMQVWGPAGQRLYIGKAPNTPMPSTRNSLYYEVSASTAVFESSITAQ